MNTTNKWLLGGAAAVALLLMFGKKKPEDAPVEEMPTEEEGGGAGAGGGGGGERMIAPPSTDPTQGNGSTSNQGAPSVGGNVLLINNVPPAPTVTLVGPPTISGPTLTSSGGVLIGRSTTGSGTRKAPRTVTMPPSNVLQGPPTKKTVTNNPSTPSGSVRFNAHGEDYMNAAAASFVQQGYPDGYLNAIAAGYSDQDLHDGYFNAASATNRKFNCTKTGGTWIMNQATGQYECRPGGAIPVSHNDGGFLNAAAAKFADQGYDGYLNIQGTATINKRNCTNTGGTWIMNQATGQYECKNGGGALIKNKIASRLGGFTPSSRFGM